MKITKHIALLAIAAFTLASCGSGEGFQTSNVAYQYNTRELAPRPEFVVHHLSPDRSMVYYRLNSSNLLYMKNAEGNNYQGKFSIRFELVPSFENTTILDSGLIQIKDEAPQPPHKAIVGKFVIKTNSNQTDRYVLRLQMTDLNRKVEFENFIRIDKSSDYSNGNFLLTDTSGNVLFKNHVASNTPFNLSYNQKEVDHYYVSYYERDFPLALPPYSSVNDGSFELEPDTTFRVPANKRLSFDNSGFYHFRIDTSQWQGFTVYSFYDQFPYIAKKKQLGPPLRYLTTRREYDELEEVMDQPDKLKQKVDDFWLNRTGSVERSKVLLEAYYKRVQEANIFFSSYLEGWKSDRGIIYIIYGPPNRVYRSSSGESWVYGDENSALSYYFNFLKVKNPFSNNDYSLDRLSTYRYGWGQAIESWRNGHIYNSKDIEREQNEQDQNRYRQRPPYWY